MAKHIKVANWISLATGNIYPAEQYINASTGQMQGKKPLPENEYPYTADHKIWYTYSKRKKKRKL